MERLYLLVLLSVTVTMVTGSCWMSRAVMRRDGNLYCEYQGWNFGIGSSFKSPDCWDCSCNNGALSCCGYGINAGVVNRRIPVGCKWVTEGCTGRLVKIHDETQDCQD